MGESSNGNQSLWWARGKPKPESAPPRYRAVAYYRHSAQDRQENSVAIQQELVTKWAVANGVDIIHEFSDRGKSGLTAEGRDAFQDMMANWVKKRNDFDFVLCLDVSRWGRFQDIDLSATYSAECKRHGKRVIYTTLGMPRPDDPLYPVYVQFERFRAAQYSKELSVKVFHGCMKIAQQGYWVGRKPPYGFRRLLLDEARRPVQVLAPRQRKSIQNQRVTLTLGDEAEVDAVQRIFHEYAEAGHTIKRIAEDLNRDGVASASGRSWNASMIRRILKNAVYVGTLVYNKTTQKLLTPTRRNPHDQWVRTTRAFDPLVKQDTFDRAQQTLEESSSRFTPEFMLDELTRLVEQHDFIRPSFVRADPLAPSPTTYATRFASLDAAYQQVFRIALGQVREEVEGLVRGLASHVEAYDDFLVINRKFTVFIQPSVPMPHGYDQYWYFRPDDRGAVDITLGVPVSGPKVPQILGYLALPRLLVRGRGIRLFGSSHSRLDMYGH